MERINLSVLSGASHDGMLQLKSYVDMTGSDPQHQSYDYECLFPETCNPREICLSFTKSADKYIFRVNPHLSALPLPPSAHCFLLSALRE